VKKRFILFMLLPAISLTANTSSFYERVGALQNHKQSTYSQQHRRVIVNTPRKSYRNTIPQNRRVITRDVVRKRASLSVNRVPKSRLSSSVDSKKFFYATRAAKRGNAKAQFDLAIIYATGKGVQRNEKIAFNWFHKSARNNYAPAKHYMGISFLQGRGVRKQKELARYWFRLAVKQGYRASVTYLSKIDANRV
jgi:TPR repeat protein